MLEKNDGGFDKIIEQLMEEVRLKRQVKDSSDFQEFSNLMENLAWPLRRSLISRAEL
jgi:hypothetical protein